MASDLTILKNALTTEITGTDSVNGLSYQNQETGEQHHIELSGVFVQVGLVPNTAWLGDTVERNEIGEIVVNTNGATNIPGVFAAGDCTNVPYKQIVTAMGAGATASLSAFDHLVRNYVPAHV